ncbi:hypothetical protein [Anaerotignum sp.]
MKRLFENIRTLMIETKKKPIGLRKKFVSGWIYIFVCNFLITMIAFQTVGVVLISEDELYQELAHENENRVAEIQEHLNIINFQSDRLAKCIGREIQIFRDREQKGDLNGTMEQFTELQKVLVKPLQFTKVISPCSGAYFVLEANRGTESAEGASLRPGLYLRTCATEGALSEKWGTTILRGDIEIAEERNLKVNEQWQKEVDIRQILGYEDFINSAKNGQKRISTPQLKKAG